MIGLSICVPVYNFNCIASVKALCEQIEHLNIESEVLVIDDASPIELIELQSFKNSKYKYEKLNKNIGRAKIRNLLARKALFNYILFIDGDSGILDNFIQNFISEILKNPNHIIYGGTLHQNPSRSNKLRFSYSKQFEYHEFAKRNIAPYSNFRTNNFVSPSYILEKIPFNESLTKYGHEDSFFSFQLEENKINLTHIKNPVIHLESDTNIEFIKKTKAGLDNLIFLEKQYPNFAQHIKLLQIVNSSKLFKIKIVKVISKKLSRLFETISIKTNNAFSFQIFKFFYIISIKN